MVLGFSLLGNRWIFFCVLQERLAWSQGVSYSPKLCNIFIKIFFLPPPTFVFGICLCLAVGSELRFCSLTTSPMVRRFLSPVEETVIRSSRHCSELKGTPQDFVNIRR